MSKFGKMTGVRRGSVLLEVLVSVVILGAGLTWVIQSMTASLKVSRQSPDYTAALILLENEMTALMSGRTISSDFVKHTRFPAPYDKYICSMTARPAERGGIDNINEVSAQISWRSGRRDNKIVLKTFLLNTP